ncbi:unnamed protein product [Orchesella dallaii]|uniref:Presequence protease, mitochondrial n=1 Tax=Orchesella dallaii TaxID=48710 RepID=A0ABP1PPZ6_9HEXA
MTFCSSSSSSCDSSCCSLKREPKFDAVFLCRAHGTIPVTKYICQWSGLEVVHAEISGPIVNGYIVIGTRVEDEDGLPHTLEHLTFLGSEDYPFNGALERAANKCFASGTNAWTDVDHTCFTVSTAGGEGFCAFLPVYLDHIFFPLLSESAFKTEIYHITGKGTDAGTVYLEMQALENTSYEKSMNTLLKTLYPPESGYHYNVGGKMQNLRESCTNEKVKNYHRKFYHLRNACVIVCGIVDKKSLFRSLMTVIDKFIPKDNPTESLPSVELSPKPWINEVIPDLPAAVEKSVKVCSEDIGCLVSIGFLGPSTQSEFEDISAMLLLGKYLASGSGSPLQQAFVEGMDNFSTSLDFSVAHNKRPAFFFELENVTKEEKSKIVPRLRKVLSEQVDNFNMHRMKELIRSDVQQEVNSMENSPHTSISQIIIHEFLFEADGKSPNQLEKFSKRLNKIQTIQGFINKPATFWTKLLQDRFMNVNWATIFTEPSNELEIHLAMEEEHRISGRKEVLGGEGMQKLAQVLDNALIQNSAPIPQNILKRVKAPSTKSISYHPIHRIHNPSWISGFPVNMCVDDVCTNFFHVGVLMDTSTLSPEFRRYLPLFKETILNSPIRLENKQIVPHEQVITQRSKDLQICEMQLGLDVQSGSFSCGSYSHILALGFQMELGKVEEGMSWVKKTLWDTHWQMDRIKASAYNLIGDILLLKRDGQQLSQIIMKDFVYADNSNVIVTSSLRQLAFLQNVCDKIMEHSEAEENELFTVFDTILSVITDPSNISIHIATNLSKLPGKMNETRSGSLKTILRNSFAFGVNTSEAQVDTRMAFANYPDTLWMKSIKHLKEDSNKIIYGLSTESNSYLVMIAPGPTSYQDRQLPALLTALRYFTQLAGTFHSKTRGEAPYYFCNAYTRVSEGLIYFQLAHCVDLVDAYRTIVTMYTGYVNKTIQWSEELFQAAKTSLIFESMDSEKTPLSLAANSLLSYYRNVAVTFSRDLNARISKVRLKEMRNAARKYLKPLFSQDYACVVVCPFDRIEDVKSGMKMLGKNLTVKNSFDD